MSAAARPIAEEVGGAWMSRRSTVLMPPAGHRRGLVAGRGRPSWAGTLVGFGSQAAQQDSFETSVRKDWAAIFRPSAIVRYGHHRVATWSTVMPADKM